ncbi:MAG: hypothetical protein N2444_06280 [Methylocystis sp.]|nr:hypothetical protein [Methylocystis sp.]
MRLRVFAICALIGFALVEVAAKEPTGPRKSVKSVSLENKRHVALQRFEVVMSAANPARTIVVGRLDRPLQAGEKARLALIGAKGCVFEARWAFDDIKDFGDVDLCGGGHIVLAD